MKNLTKILMVAVIAIMASCSKEGPQGPQGPAGTNGTNGTDGNANVKVLLWNTPPTGVFVGSNRYDFEFIQSDITANIINTGAVLVYLSFSSATWDSAPFWYSTTNYASYYMYHTPTPKIIVASSTTFISKARIVLIGGPASGTTVVNRTSKPWNSLTQIEKAQSLYPDVDFTNYESVKEYFKFKE